MTPDQRYAQLVEELPEADPASPGRGFGSGALKVGDKIFAMLTDGRLVVKLPRQRVDELVDAGEGERLVTGGGRQMKEWLALHPTSPQEWLPLAREAMASVAAKR